MNVMDNWDDEDGLLNGMKDNGLPPAPPDFGDNLETKPILEDIDSYLNKNSALITSKETAEENVGSVNQPSNIIFKKEASSPVKSFGNGHTNNVVSRNNGVMNNTNNMKSEPKSTNTKMVFTPFMVAPGIIGFDASVQSALKPVKRGRPRIHPIKPDTGVKRKPGRPRIHPVKPSDGIKRKPGRPRIHPTKPGDDGIPRRPAIIPTTVRHIRPKPDPSLITFTGAIPQLPHTFIPTAPVNPIQIPTPQTRPAPVRFVTPIPIIDPVTGKRKRGRPRIHPVKIHDGVKRKPGRPRKVPLLPTNNDIVKIAPQPVFKQETSTVEKKFIPSVRSSDLVEKVDFVENKNRRFSIEAEVLDTECKPFMCIACGDCFCTSEELMSHVVKHEEEANDNMQHDQEISDTGTKNGTSWPVDAVRKDPINNAKNSWESVPKSSLNYVEHTRKLAKLSQDTVNAYSINKQQHEQHGNTNRNEVAMCS